MDILFIWSAFLKLLAGIPLTLWLSCLALSGGFIIALLLLGLRQATFIGDYTASFYVYIFRGSPLLVQLFLIYYGLAQFTIIRTSFLWPALKSPFFCAALAMALNDAAYTSEILRAALKSVPLGAREAAEVSGMSRATTLYRIVLPLAFRQALPAYAANATLMIKASSLASTVTLMEVTGIARSEAATTYRAIEVFLGAALIYLAIVTCVSYAAEKLERRITRFQHH